MIPILYESNETAFVSNGLGRLRDCMTCEVTEERNGIYELDFTYPVDGANYDMIQPGRIIAVTHDDTSDVQPFDIVSFSKPISGVVTFHAVHISYRLSTMVAWSTGINSLTSAMNLLNNISGSSFSFSASFTSNGYMAAADGVPRSVRQLLGGIEGSILDTYGGEYEFSGFDVKLYKSRGVSRDLTIRYGVNLLDYNEEADYQSTYTSVVPYWTGIDETKQVVVRGSRVDSGLTPYNSRRQVVPLDLTEKFENKPTAAQLQTEAATYLAANQPNLPAQTISVDFFRLQDTPEYEELAGLLTCQICDTINVVFPTYNMQGRFKIVKTVWNVLEERYSSMELGNLSTSLAEALGISTSPMQVDNSATAADFIVTKGKSGNWYYEQWSSGKTVAVGYYTFSTLSFSASGSLYRSVSNAFTIPSGIFANAPVHGVAWIQGSNMVYIGATVGGLTTTGGNCEVWKSTSGIGSNVAVHMKLIYTP